MWKSLNMCIMKNLASIENSIRLAMRLVFAGDLVKQRMSVGGFSNVKEFIESRIPNKDIKSIEVVIVAGDLYKDNEHVYGAFFGGSENLTSLQVRQGDSLKPFSISTDIPMIVLGDMDALMTETTLVHELQHYLVPKRHRGDYASDPDEMAARNFEREYLKKYYHMASGQVEHFMKKKYFAA